MTTVDRSRKRTRFGSTRPVATPWRNSAKFPSSYSVSALIPSGSPKPGVVLDEARAPRREHESPVEDPAVRDSVRPQSLGGALEDVDRGVPVRLGEERQEVVALGVRAHPAGVPAAVALERPLKILDRGHRVDSAVGDERHLAELLALELLLDQDLSALQEERFRVRRSLLRFREIGALHPDALARGEAIRLHDERSADLGDRSIDLVDRRGTDDLRRGVDPVPSEEFSGVELGRLEPGAVPRGADGRDLGGPQRIGDSRGERRLRADDRDRRALLASERDDPGPVVRVHAERGDRDPVDPGVRVRARGEDLRARAFERRGDRVLSRSTADDQESHTGRLPGGGES